MAKPRDTEPQCPVRLARFRVELPCEHAGELTIDRATGEETCSDCRREPSLPCIESIETPGRCLHCGDMMQHGLRALRVRRRQAAAQHVFGGLLAPDDPPLSHGALLELRQVAAEAGGFERTTRNTLARLLDALDIANAENRELASELASAQRELETYDRLEGDSTPPDEGTLEAWRSDADRWARYGVMPAEDTRVATQRIATLIDALRRARSANVALGRTTLEQARQLEQRLVEIKAELGTLLAKAERVDAARSALFGSGGSHATASTRTAFGLDPALIEPVPDDAPHHQGCPDCLRLQRAAARKRAH